MILIEKRIPAEFQLPDLSHRRISSVIGRSEATWQSPVQIKLPAGYVCIILIEKRISSEVSIARFVALPNFLCHCEERSDVAISCSDKGTGQICLHFLPEGRKLWFRSVKPSRATVHRTVAFRSSNLASTILQKENAHQMVCVSFWRYRPDLNWRMRVLQTLALPLGHGTI